MTKEPATMVLRCALLAALLLAPADARAQIFIASKPDPPFTIGPLIIRATVTPSLTPVDVEVRWALYIPPGKSHAGIEQDIFLLWPGEVTNPNGSAAGDKELTRYVEKRGFAVLGDGRLPLYAQNLYAEGAAAAPTPVGEAGYVNFVQDSPALGLSPVAAWIRIPWTPQTANVTYMTSLLMRVGGVIKPRNLRWYESLITGERYQFSLSFNEVRDRPLFPMYAEHRDRAIRLADAPAELVVHFTHVDHLRIEQVYPPTSIRRLSETLESTEVVSLFMGSADGITPQHMTVQFGYFSRVQGLMIVLIPLLLLAVGPALGPALGRAMPGLLARLRARLHVGASGASPRARGVVLEPETLDRIVPGTTTREEVLRLGGSQVEEEQRRDQPDRRVLIYRGWRAVPATRRPLRWIAIVEAWEIFVQEARIEIERDVVKDVQVLVRRSRGPSPEPPV